MATNNNWGQWTTSTTPTNGYSTIGYNGYNTGTTSTYTWGGVAGKAIPVPLMRQETMWDTLHQRVLTKMWANNQTQTWVHAGVLKNGQTYTVNPQSVQFYNQSIQQQQLQSTYTMQTTPTQGVANVVDNSVKKTSYDKSLLQKLMFKIHPDSA